MLGANCSPCCSPWVCYHIDDNGPPVNPTNVLVQVPTCYQTPTRLEVKAGVCFNGPVPYGCIPQQVYEIALSGDAGTTWTLARLYDGTNDPPLADRVEAGGGQTCSQTILDYSLDPYSTQYWPWQPLLLRVRVRAQSESPGGSFGQYSSGVVVQTITNYGSIFDPRIRWAFAYYNTGQPAFTPGPSGIVLDVSTNDEYGCGLVGTLWDWDYVAVPAVVIEGTPIYPQPLPANPVWSSLTSTAAGNNATRNLQVGSDGKIVVTATASINAYDTVYLRLSMVNNPAVFYVERFVNE